MRKLRVVEAVQSLSSAVGRVSAGALAAALGVSRQAAHRHLAELVRRGVLTPHGGGRSTHYLPAEAVSRRVLPIARLEEDALWRSLVAEEPALALPENAASTT